MNTTLALSEVFGRAVRTRLDPAMAAHGFHRIEGSPWRRTVYLNGSRFLAIDVHLEPLDRPRWVTVMLGDELGAIGLRPRPGVALEAAGKPCRYPMRSASDVSGVVDDLLADLDAHAFSFLNGERPWLPGPAPFVHPLPIGA